ncbi:MAG: FkbM family methyltransferase [Acidimicrobiales bacterium]|nr:FkbM family methyltransferase [Acidimicrobiales bacterium]
MSTTLPDKIARAAMPVSRAYLRHFPVRRGKLLAWQYLVEPFVAWRRNEYVTQTAFGATMCGRTDELLQQYVYFFGVWEPQLTEWIMERLKPGHVFVDVGANAGYFTLLGSQLVGAGGRVVAVEASRSAMRDLQRNLAQNPTDNVRVVHAAVADGPGRVPFYRGPADNRGLSGMLPGPEHELEGEVATDSLPHLLTGDERRRTRLIKIDIEGAEVLAVRGMRPILESGHPDLEVLVEVDPARLRHQGMRAEEIFEIFATAGFTPYAIENDYSASGYVKHQFRRPRRLRDAKLVGETDVLFSRIDAVTL